MTDRNELERLLATIDAAKRLVYGLPVAAIRSDTHGNKMALWCDNGLAGVGQVCVAVNVGEFPDEQLTGIATLANCAIALRNNAQHYLSLMDEVERLRATNTRLYTIILENRADTTIADNGMTVWDGLQNEARQALGETHDN